MPMVYYYGDYFYLMSLCLLIDIAAINVACAVELK